MKKKFTKSLFLPVFLLFLVSANAFAHPRDTSLAQKKVNGVSCNVVTINLNSKDIECSVSTGQDGTHYSEPFLSQIKRNNVDIACNGNFFQAYSKQGMRNYWGDLSKSTKFEGGGVGGGYGKSIYVVNKKSYETDDWSSFDSDDVEYVACVSGDPVLLENGKNVVGLKSTTRNDLNTEAQRTGMGVTKDNKLIIVTSVISINKLADVMKTLGCNHAVNLDGGASSALYYRGKTVTAPGRDLNVVFYVRDNYNPKKDIDKKNNVNTVIKATISKNKIRLDDNSMDIEAYNIEGNNYFMLRDLASLLRDTDKNFDVKYNQDKKAIELEKGKSFEKSEVSSNLLEPKNVLLSKQKLYIDGEEINGIKTYAINGNNYFMLRDIAQKIGFDVDYDNNTREILIKTK